MFQTKLWRESKHTFFVQNFFVVENRTVFDTALKYIVEQGRSRMEIWRMRISFRITKATNTHSQYVILIVFPLKRPLNERASIWRLYVRCLSCYIKCGYSNANLILQNYVFTNT
jgi:hypothetical protein